MLSFLSYVCIFPVIPVGELLPGIFWKGMTEVPFSSGIPRHRTPYLSKKIWLNWELGASSRHFLQGFHSLGDSNETEGWVPVLGIFVLWFHHAQGSQGPHLALCSLISFLSAPNVSLHEVRHYRCFFGLQGDEDLTAEDFLGNWTAFHTPSPSDFASYKRH